MLLTNSSTVRARCFREGKPVSGVSEGTFSKVTPRPAEAGVAASNGLKFAYYEGNWEKLPDFGTMKPKKEGVVPTFVLSPKDDVDHFGFAYTGFVKVPELYLENATSSTRLTDVKWLDRQTMHATIPAGRSGAAVACVLHGRRSPGHAGGRTRGPG